MRHVLSAAILGAFLNAFAAYAGDDAKDSCAVNLLLNKPTTLAFPAGSSCASGVLPGKSAFEVLKNDIAKLKPGSSMLDTYELYPWSTSVPTPDPVRPRLTRANCPEAKIVRYEEHNHRALIQCQCPAAADPANPTCKAPDLAASSWVNLDFLSCYPKNVVKWPRPTLAKPKDPDCPPVEGSPLTAQPKALAKAAGVVAGKYGELLLARAKEHAKIVKELINQDSKVLYAAYAPSKKSDKDIAESFKNAEAKLTAYRERSKSLYGDNCDGIPPDMQIAQWTQGQRTCRLIRLSLAKVVELRESVSKSAGPKATPEILGGKYRDWIKAYDGVGRDEEGGDLDNLAFRMVLLNGLSDAERGEVLKPADKSQPGIGLIRVAREHAVPGKPDILELHDGYVFGGFRLGVDGAGKAQLPAYDCSDFIAVLLKDRRSTDVPSTAHFASIARWLYKEPGASQPTGDWADYRHCFQPVMIREGESLLPGDIIIRRIDSDSPESNSEHEGHLAVVKSFDAETGMIKTIEAAGSSMSTVGHNTRPLYETSCEAPVDGSKPGWTPVRSDLRALRFRPDPMKGCPLQAPKLD